MKNTLGVIYKYCASVKLFKRHFCKRNKYPLPSYIYCQVIVQFCFTQTDAYNADNL